MTLKAMSAYLKRIVWLTRDIGVEGDTYIYVECPVEGCLHERGDRLKRWQSEDERVRNAKKQDAITRKIVEHIRECHDLSKEEWVYVQGVARKWVEPDYDKNVAAAKPIHI